MNALCPLHDAYVIHHPDGTVEVLYRCTDKGLAYHASAAPNLLVHGPRGTGKSMLMRWDFHMRAQQYPGYVYLILRRTMPELKQSHLHFIDAEMEKLGGFYHHTDNVAVYANGSRGYFGHCETDADILKYLGKQFYGIGFDELTTFEWDMVIKISSACRVPDGCGLTAIVRAGTNPLGVSAEDVHRYYIAKDLTPEEDPDYDPADWVAMQCMPEDNPFLDHQQYRKRFAGLPDAFRRAWLLGEWGVEGAYFSLSEGHELEALPTFGPPHDVREVIRWPWMNIYRVVDWGWHDSAICVWFVVLPNGREIGFREELWIHTTAKKVAEAIVAKSDGMRVIATIADPTMWKGLEETGTCMADIFERAGVPLTKSVNDREANGCATQEHLNTEIDGQPKLQFVKTGCAQTIRTLKLMKVDKKRAGRIADHKQDHLPIGVGYFCMADVVPSRPPRNEPERRWLKHKTTRRILGTEGVRHHVARP
jgi:hypothetical protein